MSNVWVATYVDLGAFTDVIGVAASAGSGKQMAEDFLMRCKMGRKAETWNEIHAGRHWLMWLNDTTAVEVQRFIVGKSRGGHHGRSD